MALQWIHISNATHSYSFWTLFASPEGWLFCLVVAAGVFLDEAQDIRGKRYSVIFLALSFLFGAYATFDYSEMTFTFRNANTSDYWWIRSEFVFVLVVTLFATFSKVSQSFKSRSLG